jgi:hypothetical protein
LLPEFLCPIQEPGIGGLESVGAAGLLSFCLFGAVAVVELELWMKDADVKPLLETLLYQMVAKCF